MNVFQVSMRLVLPDHGILVVVTLQPVTDHRKKVLSVQFRLNYLSQRFGIQKKIGLDMLVLLLPP